MILFSEEKDKGNIKNLIPVHINICRCDNYYWNWKKEIGDWVRGDEIPEQMKRMYNKSPQTKPVYL